jgi:hypothetical protein
MGENAVSELEVAVLRSIESLGKSDCRSIEICRRVAKFVNLMPKQLRVTYGRPAYYHAVRSYLSNLSQAGYVTNNGDATYTLTSRGESALR